MVMARNNRIEAWIGSYTELLKKKDQEIGKLEQENKLLNDIIEDLEDTVKDFEKLEKENAMMKEALEFYADKDTWQSVYVGYGDKSQIKGLDLEDLSSSDRPDEYGGKLARQTLKELEGKK